MGIQTAHGKCCYEETVGRGQSYSADSLPPCIQPQSNLTAQWRSFLCAADSQRPGSDQAVESASKAVLEALSAHITVHWTIFPGNTETSSSKLIFITLIYNPPFRSTEKAGLQQCSKSPDKSKPAQKRTLVAKMCSHQVYASPQRTDEEMEESLRQTHHIQYSYSLHTKQEDNLKFSNINNGQWLSKRNKFFSCSFINR